MGINPLAAARKEAQRQTYIDEERKLVELGKRRTDAAKKAASENKEKDLIGARNAETESVFDKIGRDYAESSHQQKEDEKDDEWLREFETSLKEETGTKSYQSPITKAANTRNETFMKAYESGEKWLMSDDGSVFENVIKGIVNRMRSAPGEAVEDFSYFLNDIIPEDSKGKAMRYLKNNAREVFEDNYAGQIGSRATEQFKNAKNKTNYFGDRVIDAADSLSGVLSYGALFGPANLAATQGAGNALNEYRYQRENGTDKSEALSRAGTTGLVSYLTESLGGIGAKNSIAPKVDFSDITKLANASFKNAFQEGGEEFAEYTLNSLTDILFDMVYQDEISIEWDFENLSDDMVTGVLTGGVMAPANRFNGRELDIAEEMDKIVTENKDKNRQLEKAEKLYSSLGNNAKAKGEVEKLIWFIKDPKTISVKGVTRNAFGKPVIKIEHSTIEGAPKSITQKQNSNGTGGIVRNYYNKESKQYKQIANNDENKDENKKYVGGIHAHDYDLTSKNAPSHLPSREMKTWEILENGDVFKGIWNQKK